MSVLPDKLIFLLICTSFYLNTASGQFRAVPVIITIIISAAGSLLDRVGWRVALALVYILTSVFFSELLFFIPLICLDLFLSGKPLFALAAAVPVFYHYADLETAVPFQLILLVLLAWLFARRTETMRNWREQAFRTRDDAHETSMSLKQKQRDLIERQNIEIDMARLKERNRIAHEIHDNLGHQLSRAIIQLGALKTICRDDQAAQQIESVSSTLTEGMDNIRDSIHNLYGHSLPFEQEIKRLTAGFEFCPLELDYNISNIPEQETRNAIIAIIKEALTNVIKHS
ncbi:MAG: hypothetical protein GX028_04765, partial [Clostridiaceae bacterium]|nr:hypothetical protein [Clostridiaceae bacterium]